MLDNDNKVNVINTNYAWKIGFKIQKTNIGAQKFNGSTLETFEIMIANFWVGDGVGKLKFFWKTFLVTDIKFEVILKMLFLKISNVNKLFGKKILT